MKKIYDFIIRAEVFFGAALLLSVLVVILLQIISRSFLTMPVVWSEEVARVLFIWLVFLSAAPVLARGRHIIVDVLTEKNIGKRTTRVLDVMAGLLVLSSCSFMVWASFGLVNSVSDLSLPTSGLPQVTLYGASLVAFVLLCLHAVVALIDLLASPLIPTPWTSERSEG